MLSRRLFTSTATAAGGTALFAEAALFREAAAQPAPAGSVLERIQRTKVVRTAALPGQAPYFNKDIINSSWSGMCIEMVKDIAAVFEAKVEYTESTYGNSVLDLQSDKIDL